MTRKHFEMVAAALKEAQANDTVIIALAAKFANENPRFDTKKFVKACK